jgi:hypothetical protein
MLNAQRARRLGMLSIACICTATTAFAQSGGSGEQKDIIKPERPEVSRSAEIERPSVLQIELGYEGLFRSDEFHSHQSSPLALRYAPLKQLRLELDTDPVLSVVDSAQLVRATSFGDTRIGAEWVATDETDSHPALAFAYAVKLPPASRDNGLGTGRVDHRIAVFVTRKIGETDLDANVAYLNVGRDEGDRAAGALAAVSASREFKNNVGYVAEASWQNEDDELPSGSYALGALTYKVVCASPRPKQSGPPHRRRGAHPSWGSDASPRCFRSRHGKNSDIEPSR